MKKSNQSDRKSIKVNLTCPCCSRICKNPVTLPCQDIICHEHLSDSKFVIKNIIKCPICEKEFDVRNNEFPRHNMLQRLIDDENYLNNDEKSLKKSLIQSLEVFYKLYEDYMQRKNEIEVETFDHFQEIRRKIDIQREKLKSKIDEIAMDIINKTKFIQELFNKSLEKTLEDLKVQSLDEEREELNNTFRDTNLTMNSIEQMQILQKRNISKINWERIYCGSEDGFSSSNFHSKCDAKSNTLTIIKPKDSNNLFGAFIAVNWSTTSTTSDNWNTTNLPAILIMNYMFIYILCSLRRS